MTVYGRVAVPTETIGLAHVRPRPGSVLIAVHVHGGGALLLFPHGRPSPDGAIAPLDARAGRMLRWPAPASIQPLGIAYDPLVRGRPRAVVAAATPFAAVPAASPERAVLAALRVATPLTAGHVVAHETVRRGAPPSLAAALRALAEARAGGRPAARDSSAAADVSAARDLTAARVGEAIAAVTRLGAAHPLVLRTARTHATASAGPP